MNAYPIGNDLTVKWSLLYSDGSVFPLSLYEYELSYRTSRGTKVVTDTAVVSVDENILTWSFNGDQQVASGLYSLNLKITLSGSSVVELQYDNAFMLSPLRGFKGAGSEIVLQSICDAIDLKEAVLQSRKSLDLAAAAEKKASASVEVSSDAKVKAEEALGKATTAEEKTRDAEAAAQIAQESAQSAAGSMAAIQASLDLLGPDQSGALALAGAVNSHGEKLSELEEKNALLGFYDKGEVLVDAEKTDWVVGYYIDNLSNFVSGGTTKTTLVSVEGGQKVVISGKGRSSNYRVFGADGAEIKKGTSAYFSEVSNGEFVMPANAAKLQVNCTSAETLSSISVKVYKNQRGSRFIDDTNEKLNDLTGEMTVLSNSHISAKSYPYEFKKGKKYAIVVKNFSTGWMGLRETADGKSYKEWQEQDGVPHIIEADRDYHYIRVGSMLVSTIVEISLIGAIDEITDKLLVRKPIDIDFVIGEANTSGNTKPTTFSTDPYWVHSVLDVKAGDSIKFTCEGGSSPRAYAIYDENGTKTRGADANASLTDYTIEIAENEKCVILQSVNSASHGGILYSAVTSDEAIEESMADIRKNRDEIEAMKSRNLISKLEYAEKERIVITDELDGFVFNPTESHSIFCADFFDRLISKFDELCTSHEAITKYDAVSFVNDSLSTPLSYPAYANLNGRASGDYLATPSYTIPIYKIGLPTSATMNAKKVDIVLIAGQHGWEISSPFNSYVFARHLLEASTDNYAKLLQSANIYILPLLNVYGCYHGFYVNANGVNINRNYPYDGWTPTPGAVPFDSQYAGTSAGSEFETKLAMAVLNKIKPQIALDMHGNGSDEYYVYLSNPSYGQAFSANDLLAEFTHLCQKQYANFFGTGYKPLFNTSALSVSNAKEGGRYLDTWIWKNICTLGGTFEVNLSIYHNNGVKSQSTFISEFMGENAVTLNEWQLRNFISKLWNLLPQ